MSAPLTGRRLTRVELEREVQGLHGRYWEDQREAARGKNVVLVEGDDDADIVGTIFQHRKRTWEATARIVVAGGRARVLEQLGASAAPTGSWLETRGPTTRSSGFNGSILVSTSPEDGVSRTSS